MAEVTRLRKDEIRIDRGRFFKDEGVRGSSPVDWPRDLIRNEHR